MIRRTTGGFDAKKALALQAIVALLAATASVGAGYGAASQRLNATEAELKIVVRQNDRLEVRVAALQEDMEWVKHRLESRN